MTVNFDVAGDLGFGPSLSVRVGSDEWPHHDCDIYLGMSVSGETNATAHFELQLNGAILVTQSANEYDVVDNLIKALQDAKAESIRRKAQK